MAKNRNRPIVCVSLDKSVVEFLDREADKLSMSRSQLMENCIVLAVSDFKLLKKFGLIQAVKFVKGFQGKFKGEMFQSLT
jgi:hypothetical protein